MSPRKNQISRERAYRALKLLTEDTDGEEIPQDIEDFIEKYICHRSDREWLELVGSKDNHKLNMSTSGNESNLPRKHYDNLSHSLYHSVGKERRNVLVEDDEEEGIISPKESNWHSRGKCDKSPSMQPVVLLEKLGYGTVSSYLPNIHMKEEQLSESSANLLKKGNTSTDFKWCYSNKTVMGSPATATHTQAKHSKVTSVVPASVQRRKFFATPRKELTSCRGGTSRTLSSVNKKQSSFQSMKSWGRKDITLPQKRNNSEKIVLNNTDVAKTGRWQSLQLSYCNEDLDKERDLSAATTQHKRSFEKTNIQKKIKSMNKSVEDRLLRYKKVRVSTQKAYHNAKARIDEYLEEYEEDRQNQLRVLFRDQPEKYGKLVADINEQQSSQNSPTNNPSDCIRIAQKITVQCETKMSNCNKRKCVFAHSGDGIKDDQTRNAMDSDTKSTVSSFSDEDTSDWNSMESINSSFVSSVSLSSNKVTDVGCQRHVNLNNTMCPSLQPIVVLRNLTDDEIKRYTSGRFLLQDRHSGDYVDHVKSVTHLGKSGNGAVASTFKERLKIFCSNDSEMSGKSYASETGSKGKCLNYSVSNAREREKQQSLVEERQGSENEENIFRVGSQNHIAKLYNSGVVRNGMMNCLHSETSHYYSCNAERKNIFEEITQSVAVNNIVPEYRSDTGSEAVAFTALASDKRKCCRNEVCESATPELIGLENPVTANRCWMNVTLQMLFSMESFMNSMGRAFEAVNIEENSLVTCILKLYYARSQGHQECVYEQSREFVKVIGNLNHDYLSNEQRDPSEFIFWLFNTFEPAVKRYCPNWASDLIGENFRFEMEERTCCTSCVNFEVKSSDFLILMLDICNGTSTISTIEEALTEYTTRRIIKKKCSQCGGIESLFRTTFKSFPRYLIINLKRYSMKGGRVIREEAAVKYPNNLSLGKYSFTNNVNHSCEDGSSVAVASSPAGSINMKSLRRAQGGYDLISVIHHSGDTVSSGHYICDAYDRQTNKWYSYNDKMVKEVSLMKLLSAKKQRTGYIYVYQNKNS